MPFSCSRQRCHGNRPPNAPPFFRFLFFLRRCMRCNNIIYRRLLVSSCLQFIIDLISNNRVSQYYCHDPRPKAQFSLFQAYNHEIWPPALSLFSRLPPTIRLIRFASFLRVKPPRMPDLFPQQLISVPYIIRLPSIMRCGNVITCLIVHTPIKWLISGETCLVLIGRRAFIPRRTVEFVCLTTKPVTSCLCARCSRTFCCCSEVCVTLNL